VKVAYWDGGVEKYVPVDFTVDDIFGSFVASCRSVFGDELDGSIFRIYAFPHGFDDINQRERIQDGNQLLDVFHDHTNPNLAPRVLYIFKENISPEKLPKESNNVYKMETLSIVSRDTDASLSCRTLSNFTCVFCGYRNDNIKGAVVAAHIFEVKHFNKIKGKDISDTWGKRNKALQEKGLSTIHDSRNLICLCNACHPNFDTPYELSITPDTRQLLVGKNIRKQFAGSGVYFESLHGKVIAFAGPPDWQPPIQLLQYRFDFFVSNQCKEVKVGKGKTAKTTKTYILYCSDCLHTFADKRLLEDHFLICEEKQSRSREDNENGPNFKKQRIK
jgi:hypothetical protein